MATRSPSLSLRLTLLFALASAFVLLLLGLLIGNAVERHFEEQDMEALGGKMHLALHILERNPPPLPTEILAQQLDNALTGHHDLAVAVYDQYQQMLYANQDIAFPINLLNVLGPNQPAKWTTDQGVPWRGIAATASFAPNGDRFTVLIATEIAHHEHFMRSFRETLWVFMGLASLVMGALGWLAVQRGIAPLRDIKRQTSEITANRLDTRLPVESIPRELADLAQTLNGMLSRLEESFQRLSDFSSDLAHELRTPVSNLLTQTQVTLSKARSVDEYRDVLASNTEEFERLSCTISDMLFLAKADHNQITPNHEPINLAEEIRSLLEYYEVLADEKAISVTFSGESLIVGDRLMLRRAVSNLLSNALRHTPSGGAVMVCTGDQAEGNAFISVENTGADIPAEHLPRLFDRFYRVDSSRLRTSENSGLGLAITHSILMAHGGTVGVKSEGGKTQFTLSLPRIRI